MSYVPITGSSKGKGGGWKPITGPDSNNKEGGLRPFTLAEKHGWKRPKAIDPINPNEKYEWHRPSAQGGEIKSRFGFSSEFMPSDKGWTTFFGFYLPFLGGFHLIYKQGKILVNLLFIEWHRQRSEDFEWLHGLTEKEAKADRNKWVESSNARQEYFKNMGLV